MEWRDEGIILATRKHGETSVILEVMTRGRGRHLGMVRGGRSRKMRPFLQPGNRVDLSWRARLDEQLGTFQAEPIEQNAARLLESATAVHGLQTLAAHLRLLPERDPHIRLYETLGLIIAHLDDATVAGALVARFEIMVLDELGFGLDLLQCAATGTRDNLIYVSPKTGRAVSAEAGAPWADKLLPLPSFLKSGAEIGGDGEAISAAFRLSGYFLARHVYEPRGISAPQSRASFLAALLKALTSQSPAAPAG
ncbi:DNA repair protein RecO [Tianweitania sp. BSSL-BM11]|uniref:DNA repair protein RecO n=1 Tax=Tianweitania aestuarii TaxID=2814886 RepID=A0ABS5RSB5_9HYPH|nr:DNA repair protein RecO [Tianweitania aestuarii]MBS9719946.1 DNA repair protein RecO [Tianweitania aestuarii]